MSGQIFKAGLLSASVLLASFSSSSAGTEITDDLMNFLEDRYGDVQQNADDQSHSREFNNGSSIDILCRNGFGQIARGNLIEESIMGGQGQLSLNIDSINNPTVTLSVDLVTKGHDYPQHNS